MEILWISLMVFGGFELALAVNYLLLKLVLRAMHDGLQAQGNPQSEIRNPQW